MTVGRHFMATPSYPRDSQNQEPLLLGIFHMISITVVVARLYDVDDCRFQVDMPVLVIAGNADLLIPSKEEAQRLNWQLDDCRKVVLEGHSHILMQEQGVDIAEIIRVRFLC